MADLPGPVLSEPPADALSPHVQTNGQALSSSESLETQKSQGGEEQALESHEVIELQTFSERKAWIEEKIKFLEALPPIEVFVGLDAIRASAEDVPGLPTREQLQQMVAEHDAIEKETEIFDTGELKKLRKLTKAATQRNLSPEDTDVIELTLTTIYELDKLLHLLRDRSDSLEMLAIRLTWEENRQAGWRERRQIIEDLNAFAISRARWNPSIYETTPTNDDTPPPPPHRRSSIASQASAGSESGITSPAFSRSARFKLAELLSRDAAQFSGRVTSLRHGKVVAAGKALDKLIDHSRKPVPEDLLDEQDRVEEKCINELENIGKFTMSLVMQWRKADEIYVETMKDHTTASNLLEEIETAKLYHPTARQSASFASRIDTILKRLAVRGDPASPATLFPRPEHFLFPDQKPANASLIAKLSTDIAAANKLARKVDQAAKEYRATHEAVKRVETLLQSVNDLTTRLTTINAKFREGVAAGDGDGLPPDLNAETSLDPTSHGVFLALLPSLLEETALAIDSAGKLLRTAPPALLGLDILGIDHEFKENAASTVRQLSSLREETLNLRKDTTERVARLKECRRISSSVESKLVILKSIRMEMARTMDQRRWRQESGGTGAPPTPESPTAELDPNPTATDFEQQLAQVTSSIKSDISDPLDKFSGTLEPKMQSVLRQKVSVLQTSLDSSLQMLRLLGSVQEQSSAMHSIRESFHQLLVGIEDGKIRIKETIEEVLGSDTTASSSANGHNTGIEDLNTMQKEVASFVDSLSGRVVFVARHAPRSRSISLKSPLSPGFLNGSMTETDIWSEIPFDLTSVDAGVRADSNSYAMRLNGNMADLLQTKEHYDLAVLAKSVDDALSLTQREVDSLSLELAVQKNSFSNLGRRMPDTINLLNAISESLDAAKSRRPTIARSLSPIRGLLRQMDDKSHNLPPAVRQQLYQSRTRAVDDTEFGLSTWDDEVTTFKNEISLAIEAELRYQEQLRLEEDRRQKEEEERLAAEEAERLRLEKERLEEQERQRLLAEKLAEGHRQELERQRIAAEQAEKERLEYEAAEAERLRREEEERQAAAARIQEEKERLAREEEERALREKERLEMMEKLRAAEEKLEEERRLHAESERAAMELAQKQQLEMDELARRQAEMQRIAEEHARQEELDRLERERERLEREEKERAKAEADALERERLAREALEKAEREERQRLKLEEDARLEREERERIEKERLEREERERIRLAEKERLDREEKERLEREGRERIRLAEKERLDREEKERLEMEERDRIRLVEKERLEREEKDRLAKIELERLARDEVARKEKQSREAQEAEDRRRYKEEEERERASQEKAKDLKDEDVDVFGTQVAPSGARASLSPAMAELLAQVISLRKRLRSICINDVLKPAKPSTNLPSQEQSEKMSRDFLAISTDVQKLPSESDNATLNQEIQSLKAEVEQSARMLKEIDKLVDMKKAIIACDAALSDLLEHIDSYPAPPLGILSSTHKSLPTATPEEQLSARLTFTRAMMENMDEKYATVASDRRATSEHARIMQTWSELNDMAMDRIGGKKSRPGSVISGTSSGRNSSTSSHQPALTHSRGMRKAGSYSHLSASSMSSPARGKMLAPPLPSSRRAVSNSTDTPSRPTSRLSSISSNRSVSGPLDGSTFASRQRTTSLSNSTSVSTPRRPSLAPTRIPRVDSGSQRNKSPTPSEYSTHSYNPRSTRAASRTSLNSSTWSRAPRASFSSILPRNVTPSKKIAPPVRKKYVADPKSKLDVAVGDVVNQLPVGINIEGITESWRDQSGKYWIGNQDPKLCFCRILRSQTVMVRVGGGWTELSRFIKDHFADSFRMMPESPPRNGGHDEKWISSATLLETRESTPPSAPRTPEPTMPFVPSFSLMTPSGQSPHSLKSSPSAKGSPLTPLQFMRRAEAPDLALLRPATPSKTPLRSRVSNVNTPARNSVWRP